MVGVQERDESRNPRAPPWERFWTFARAVVPADASQLPDTVWRVALRTSHRRHIQTSRELTYGASPCDRCIPSPELLCLRHAEVRLPPNRCALAPTSPKPEIFTGVILIN